MFAFDDGRVKLEEFDRVDAERPGEDEDDEEDFAVEDSPFAPVERVGDGQKPVKTQYQSRISRAGPALQIIYREHYIIITLYTVCGKETLALP